MTDTPTTSPAVTEVVPPATASIHRRFLEKATPQWLLDATAQRRAELKDATTVLPAIYLNATPQQRRQLHESITASFIAQTALDKTMAGLQDIDTFAEPLLLKALKDQYGLVVDVRKTWVSLKKATQMGIMNLELGTFEVMKISLLAAAQHNFEAPEAKKGAFHKTSGFLRQGSTPDTFAPASIKLEVDQFLALCRSLDIGAKYQTYIKAFIQPTDTVKAAALREQFIASKKATMRAAAEQALLQKDIDAADYAMVRSVIDGEVFPRMGDKSVWFCELGLMKRRMNGCVVFVVAEKYRFAQHCVVYVPHDPKHPMKRFAGSQLKAHFKTKFTAKDTPAPAVARPTAYQKFFSQFVPYGDRPYYFSQFNKDGDTTLAQKVAPIVPIVSEIVEAVSMFAPFTHITNPPPPPMAPQVVEDDPYLAPTLLAQRGRGQWGDNVDLWNYLYERSQTQAIADAAAHAVPTAEVDARVRAAKIASWLNVGMFAATFFAAFVPVLGEIVLAVMAGQLLQEAFEGAIEWEEGDRKAAKAHLVDLAGNLLLLAVMHGAGKGLGKLMAIKAAPVIEDLRPVKLPNGQTRLWKPDLAPYRSDVVLPPGTRPNALGQYEIDGRLHVRLDGALYEKTYDTTLKKWRIKHPQDTQAYQPVLEHNGSGAWRHMHERPLAWDRLTLLRRLGHCTESFSDEALRTIGEVSGVHDDVLRRVHVDGAPLPAALADTLEQFRVDQEVDEVIAQIRRGTGSDSRFECVVPLTVELPRWPQGRVLEVFEGPETWGASQRHGQPLLASDVRATIKVTRAEVRAGKLGRSVLAALSDEEASMMLGSASGWNGLSREQVFNDRLANQALKRRRALFDSLMNSSTPPVTDTDVLGRRFPMLSRRATDELMSNVTATDRARLQEPGKAKVSAQLDDLARTRLQQARLNSAIAGLHRETLASAESDRLALHILEKLPGWPGDLRLEVRIDSIQGRLLDSIGDKDAPMTRYLVKDGDCFQAFDEQGQTLNGVASYSRNFFQSILHALPDNAREGLGILFTSQDELLQQTLGKYAREHREDMTGILKLRPPRARPSLRLPDGRVGYALSGRGAGIDDVQRLVSRVRDIYPNAEDSDAERFVRWRLNNGESPQQVHNLLHNRQLELQGLQATLDEWAGEDAQRRTATAEIIRTWRMGVFSEGTRPFSSLRLSDAHVLPQWQADFSHVRELSVPGQMLIGDQGAAFLERFPQVDRLAIDANYSNIDALAERVVTLPRLTRLVLHGVGASYSPAALQSIMGMTQLEELSLWGNMQGLDVSRLVNLRRLNVFGSLESWPVGLMDLEHLEALDLGSTGISSLPEAMYTGHEYLWERLNMNWGRFDTRAFRRAYDHWHANLLHPINEGGMARSYVQGSLLQMTGGDWLLMSRIVEEFEVQGYSTTEQLERIIAVREEYEVMTRDLASWQRQEVSIERGRVDPPHRAAVSRQLSRCWREGIEQRLAPGARQGSSFAAAPSPVRLEFMGPLGDLPPLPPAGFSHVRSLQLVGARVPLEELDRFLGGFSELTDLDLSSNNLVDLPSAIEQMRSLRQLDLSYNTLRMTPSLQARLDRVTSLVSLDLRFNPLRSLDVSRFSGPLRLDLSHTAMVDWPTGILELPALERLDLSHSAVTTIPPAALQGHDRLLLNTRLRGCRLTDSTVEQVRHFAQRVNVDNPLDIPARDIAAGRTGGFPEFFPAETEHNPGLLLPVPGAVADQAALTVIERLQRLDPELGTAQASVRSEALRSSGLDTVSIENRLVEWEAQHRQWVQVLNEWINVPSTRGARDWIMPLARRQAADRLMASWRYTLHADSLASVMAERQLLDFSGLRLGDLPVPPTPLPHVRQLDLTGVWITDQGSNGFLRAFTHVDSLTLENNELRVLPDAVGEFRGLTRLNAANNDLRDAAALHRQLVNMPLLETLDLSANTFYELDISHIPRLETLNVQGNVLIGWPAGVLEAPRLSSLDLSNNEIEAIPPEAFLSRHQALMLRTDLTQNILDEEEAHSLRRYLRRTGVGLGYTEQELDEFIAGYHVEDSQEAVTHFPDIEPPEVQRTRWFIGEPDNSARYRIWDTLRADENSRSLFYTLSQLRHTKDFRADAAEVSRRVWVVLEAIYNDKPLRMRAFVQAREAEPLQTCGDGRILLFNDLETLVRLATLLRDVSPQTAGAVMFREARGTMRLEALEVIAREAARIRDIDPAEIRLEYRIDLSQRLDLPPQPHLMIYRNLSRLTQADLNTAYERVIAGEAEGALVNNMVDHYPDWMEYLRRRYTREFAELAASIEQRSDALHDRYSSDEAEYTRQYLLLDQVRRAEERALAVRLTEQERQSFGG